MPRSIIQELLDEIENSLAEFDSAIPEIQQAVYREVELMVRELELTSKGFVKPSIENLKKLNSIKGKLEKIFKNPEYLERVITFGKTYTTVTNILEEYFNKALPEFSKMPAAVFELRKQGVEQVVSMLTDKGLSVNVIEKSIGILRRNVTTGASFFDLNKEMREFILGNEKEGILQRYSKQITTDLLNQYTASVNEIVAQDLNLEWGQYVGALVKASRPLCGALVAKEFIHKSELDEILNGYVDGEKVSLAGLIEGTTPENFKVLRGGHNCNHQYIPVSQFAVPKEIRERIK